jgi:hypothetical protein
VTAAASDNVRVAGVQFKLDGESGRRGYSLAILVSWTTTPSPNGVHTLTAVARDAAGLSTTSAGVSVTVSTTRLRRSCRP